MKTVYLDPVTFQCFLTQDEENTRIIYETERFDGKCDTFIESHRIVPTGCEWVRSDGKVFSGEMVTVWKPYDELDAVQREYEKQLLAEYESALANSVPISELEKAYQEGVNSAYD